MICYPSQGATGREMGLQKAVCKIAEVGTAFQMRRAGESTWDWTKAVWCARRVMQLAEAPRCEVYREFGGVWQRGEDAGKLVGGRVGVLEKLDRSRDCITAGQERLAASRMRLVQSLNSVQL